MSNPFLGEMRIVSFNYPPKGWAFCNGQLMQIQQNAALFSLLGTTYGGDGRLTFGLPNLMGKVPMHRSTQYPQGLTSGEDVHTLQISEIPTHTHRAITAVNGPATTTDPTNAALAIAGSDIGNVYAGAPVGPQIVTMNAQAIRLTGGSPHNNMQPFLSMNIVIALNGIFPSRN